MLNKKGSVETKTGVDLTPGQKEALGDIFDALAATCGPHTRNWVAKEIVKDLHHTSSSPTTTVNSPKS